MDFAFGSSHFGSQTLLVEIESTYAEALHSFTHNIFTSPELLEYLLPIFAML